MLDINFDIIRLFFHITARSVKVFMTIPQPFFIIYNSCKDSNIFRKILEGSIVVINTVII